MLTENEKVFAAFMLNSIFSAKIQTSPNQGSNAIPIKPENITEATMRWLETYSVI